MIRFIRIITACALAGCALFACDDDADSTGERTEERDYIAFTLNNETFRLTRGLTDQGNVPFIELCNDDYIMIYGAAGDTDRSSTEGEHEVFAHLEVVDGGIEAGTYDADRVLFSLYTESEVYSLQDGFTLVIDEIPAVGGYSSGTFSGTVSNGPTNYDVTEGSFNVARIPDCFWL